MLLSKLNDPNADYTYWMEKRKLIPSRPEEGVAIVELLKTDAPFEALKSHIINAPGIG